MEVIFVSFGTLRRPANVDHWVRAWGKREGDWEGEVREMLRRNGMASKSMVTAHTKHRNSSHDQILIIRDRETPRAG